MSEQDFRFDAPDDAVQLDPSGNTFDHGDAPELEDVTSGHGPRNQYQHQADAATVRPPSPYGTLSEPDPVTVRVVESPPPRTVRRRFIATNVTLSPGDGGGYGARRILPQRFNRTLAKITAKPVTGQPYADRVWISQDESPGFATGYPLDDRETFETKTTEDVWVALDPASQAGVTLCVFAEYTTELNEHQPGDKRHSGTHRDG